MVIKTKQFIGFNCQWTVNSLTVSLRGPSLPHRPYARQKCGDPAGLWQHSGHYRCKYSHNTPLHMCTQIQIRNVSVCVCVCFCSMLTMCVYSADKISAVNAYSLTLDSSNWWWTLERQVCLGKCFIHFISPLIKPRPHESMRVGSGLYPWWQRKCRCIALAPQTDMFDVGIKYADIHSVKKTFSN